MVKSDLKWHGEGLAWWLRATWFATSVTGLIKEKTLHFITTNGFKHRLKRRDESSPCTDVRIGSRFHR